MKIYLLSDNNDTLNGLRLAGVDGVVIHTKEELISQLQKTDERTDIGILLITGVLNNLAKDEIASFIDNHTCPAVLIIPDRHGNTAESGNTLMSSAFGIK